MEAIYGLALMSASILLLAFAARFRNAPNAPNWSKSGILLQTVLFTTVTGFIFAISLLFQFVANYATASLGATEAGLAVGIVGATWLCWRAIKKMPAPVAIAAVGTADNMPPPANTDGPGLRTGRKPAGPARKAA